MAADLDLLAGPSGFSVFSGIEEADSHQHGMIPSQKSGVVRQNFNQAFWLECHPGDIWGGNNTVRVLCARYDATLTTGDDNWYVFSCLITSGSAPVDDILLWELHGPSSLYNLAGGGLAPYAIHTRNGVFNFRMVTGNLTVGQGFANFNANIPLANVPYGQTVDFLIHTKISESSGSGNSLVEVFVDLTGQGNFSASPTWSSASIGYPASAQFCNSNGVHNAAMYHEQGIYSGSASIARQTIVNSIGSARRGSRANAIAVLGPGGGSGPPPTDPEPTRFLGGKYQTGALLHGFLLDYQTVQEITMAYSGTIDSIFMELDIDPANVGTGNYRLGIFAYNGGEPGSLLAQMLNPFSLTAASADGIYGGATDVQIARLAGEKLFAGLIVGGASNQAFMPYDAIGAQKFYYQPRAYSLGLVNWNPAVDGTDDIEGTIWVEGSRLSTGQFLGMTVTDDFNRADTGPPPSGSWTAGVYS